MRDDGKINCIRPLQGLVVIVLLLMLAACSTTGPVTDQFGDYQERDLSPDRLQLVRLVRDMIGVPYRYGGSNPVSGFDCSGLVYYSYRQSGISVPRTSAMQRRWSSPVSANGLLPGDLVFFDTQGGHVGIYSGDGRFIHAPSSGGRVREERLSNPYWRKRWLGSGSLLDG